MTLEELITRLIDDDRVGWYQLILVSSMPPTQPDPYCVYDLAVSSVPGTLDFQCKGEEAPRLVPHAFGLLLDAIGSWPKVEEM